jgi:hypothetical protein
MTLYIQKYDQENDVERRWSCPGSIYFTMPPPPPLDKYEKRVRKREVLLEEKADNGS